ncbi:hypothetical protein EMIT0P228_250007 [Pseudomonas brassicacearum]
MLFVLKTVVYVLYVFTPIASIQKRDEQWGCLSRGNRGICVPRVPTGFTRSWMFLNG